MSEGAEQYSQEYILLREVGYWRYNRSHVARSYHRAMTSGENVDWDKVHAAIAERWSHFAVEWIRREAKRMLRSRVDAQGGRGR